MTTRQWLFANSLRVRLLQRQIATVMARHRQERWW
jgi:hypothetical protein